MEYRNELKFWVSDLQLEKIKYRLLPIMRLDDHQDGDFYTIRSLYFDDYFDSCLEENFSGADRRSKYRIRLYGENSDVINLECKSKLRGMTKKVGESLTREQCKAYMENDTLGIPCGGKVSQELFVKNQTKGMKPVCVVEYDRTAFIEDVGNVRITFDKNVRGTNDIDSFLKFDMDYCLPVMPVGQHILEVKYDEFLPKYILEAVDLNSLRRESISKYGLVRNKFSGREGYLI